MIWGQPNAQPERSLGKMVHGETQTEYTAYTHASRHPSSYAIQSADVKIPKQIY